MRSTAGRTRSFRARAAWASLFIRLASLYLHIRLGSFFELGLRIGMLDDDGHGSIHPERHP